MKKGRITTLTLIAISVPVILLFYTYALPWLQSLATQNRCKASVLAAASSGGTLDLQCPTEEVTISHNEITTETAHHRIAQKLRYCWTNFGKGKIDPLNKRIFDLGDLACHRCAEIQFDSSVRQASIPMETILDNTIGSRDQTVKQLLYANKENPSKYYPNKLKTDQTYYVVFMICSESMSESVIGDLPLSCDASQAAVWLVSADKYTNTAARRCQYEF